MRSLLLDLAGLAGFGMIGAGLWGFDPRIALIACGAILAVIGVWGSVR